MQRSLTLAAAALAALIAAACGDSVKVYKGQPPRPEATASAARPDPDAFRKKKPPAGKPGELKFPVPSVTTLANGLSLYLVERPSPVVTLRLVVREGASSVPLGKSGLAAITARMLTEGTTKHSGLELAEAVESLGSTLDSDASRDESRVGLSALADDLDRALELLAEVVQKPAFLPADFERVRSEWLDSLASERQDPQRLASLAALRVLNGPVHGAPVRGSVPDVQKLDLGSLREFHRRAYVPKNAALVVVGKFDSVLLKASIERHFGSWRGGAPAGPLPFAPPKPPSERRVLLVDRPESVQSAIFTLQPFPKRSEPGFEVRQVLGKVVGGLFTSRINMNLREQHAFTYGAFGEPLATEVWGAFFVSTSVRTDVTADALSELLKELERAKNPALGAPIQAAEVGRAKADLVHSLGSSLEHGSRVAEAMTTLFTNRLPADYDARYPSLLEPIDNGAVARAASELTPERLTIVVVGDRKEVEPALVKKGFKVELADPKLTE